MNHIDRSTDFRMGTNWCGLKCKMEKHCQVNATIISERTTHQIPFRVWRILLHFLNFTTRFKQLGLQPWNIGLLMPLNCYPVIIQGPSGYTLIINICSTMVLLRQIKLHTFCGQINSIQNDAIFLAMILSISYAISNKMLLDGEYAAWECIAL